MPSSSDASHLASIERLVDTLKPLPPTARVLARLQRLLGDANSGLDDIAALIRLDPGLATRVIAISNSAFFRRGLPCGTIEEAVNRVGFREVYRVVSVVISRSLVAQALPAYGRDAHRMWRESVACAFAAELLAERLGEEMPVAYVSGLLHAIGRLPINQYLLSTGGSGRPPLVEEAFPLEHSGAEYALFGFNQAAVGASMLTRWEFTPATVFAVRHQYDPLAAEEPHDRMAAVLYCARWLRTVVCENISAEQIAIDESVLALVRLSPDDVLSHLPGLRDQLARAEQLTKT